MGAVQGGQAIDCGGGAWIGLGGLEERGFKSPGGGGWTGVCWGRGGPFFWGGGGVGRVGGGYDSGGQTFRNRLHTMKVTPQNNFGYSHI